MAALTVRVSLSARWWLRPYLMGVTLYVRLTGRTPNWDRVERVISRGLVAKIKD